MENREISKGLEALENIGFEPLYQNEDGSYWRVRDENKEDFETIKKELEALQIIKNHISVIKGYIYTTDSQITDSEYKLLCEVLRCDS